MIQYADSRPEPAPEPTPAPKQNTLRAALIAVNDVAQIEGDGWQRIIDGRDLVFMVGADFNRTKTVIGLLVFSSKEEVFCVEVHVITELDEYYGDGTHTHGHSMLYKGPAILAGMETFTMATRGMSSVS